MSESSLEEDPKSKLSALAKAAVMTFNLSSQVTHQARQILKDTHVFIARGKERDHSSRNGEFELCV